MATNLIILTGATGDLGGRIAHHLRRRQASVRALVRKGASAQKTDPLRQQGVEIVEVDFSNVPELTAACAGGTCVVSALSGLHDIIVETQTRLLQAAVAAGVPRFIPSDYSIDFFRLPKGENRNLDLRREFAERLDKAPIKATSVLNGMFADLLTGQAPVILFGLKRVVYWGNPDQPLDFTTTDDTANFTAAAALDANTPRYLRVAGNVLTVNQLKQVAGEVTGKPFSAFRVGGLGGLHTLIGWVRTIAPAKNDPFPAWQGMQYLHNMFTGLPKLTPLDNDRYPDIRWTPVAEVLAKRPD